MIPTPPPIRRRSTLENMDDDTRLQLMLDLRQEMSVVRGRVMNSDLSALNEMDAIDPKYSRIAPTLAAAIEAVNEVIKTQLLETLGDPRV